MSTKSGLFTIYTLTPTHCGTGQAAGAVDLPIAREKHTELPVLPSTTLKGVARDAFERVATDAAKATVKALFGPKIEAGATGEDHHAGKLVFCEGKLLAYPARSLNKPFFFATSRLVVERLARDLRAFGFGALASSAKVPADAAREDNKAAWVSDRALAGKPLVVEDLVYPGAEVKHGAEVEALGKLFADWLPAEEDATSARLRGSLLVLPDDDFLSLVQRAVPVQARISLTDGKTTDKWKDPGDPEAKTQSGNLWYEEALPADCLFVAFVTERFQQRAANGGDSPDKPAGWNALWEHRASLAKVQIGGNETVGYGRCWWHGVQEGDVR